MQEGQAYFFTNTNDNETSPSTLVDLGYEQVYTDADAVAINHKLLSRRFGRRASTGRVCMDERPVVLEVSDTHATVSYPNNDTPQGQGDVQGDDDDDDDNDPDSMIEHVNGRRRRPRGGRAKANRRHSSGSMESLVFGTEDETRTQDFWQMYQPSQGATPQEAVEKPTTRRRGVRFNENVTVWVMPKQQGIHHNELPLAWKCIPAQPPADQTMIIPLRKTQEERLAELQQKYDEETQSKYADDGSAGSLEIDMFGGGGDDELIGNSNRPTTEHAGQQSFEFEFDQPVNKDNALAQDSFHQSCRFESFEDPEDDLLGSPGKVATGMNNSVTTVDYDSNDDDDSTYLSVASETNHEQNNQLSLLPGFDDSLTSVQLEDEAAEVFGDKKSKSIDEKSKRDKRRSKRHSKKKKQDKDENGETKKKKSKKSSGTKKSSKNKSGDEETKKDKTQKPKSPKKGSKSKISLDSLKKNSAAKVLFAPAMAPTLQGAGSKPRRRCSIATQSDVDLEVWKIHALDPLHNVDVPEMGNLSLAGDAFENFRQSIFNQFQAEFGKQDQWQYRGPSHDDDEEEEAKEEAFQVERAQEEPTASRPKRSKARRRASVAV